MRPMNPEPGDSSAPSLPVTAEADLKAVKGNNTFSVSAPQSPNAWLSSRIKVADTANRITVQKPKGTR